MRRPVAACLAVLALPALSFGADASKPSAEQVEFFEKSVRPILAENCYSCHGAKKQQGGLRLDTAEGLKKGTDTGPVVVPGDADKSRLVQSIRRKGDNPMPPDGELAKDKVAVLEQWVKLGAAYPATAAGVDASALKKHWAFQPINDPPVPAAAGVTNPIDAFVKAKQAEHGLGMSPRADKRTLARRVSFDLTGLPPTADDLDAFEKDADPKAYEKLVDKLLASPQYGERWGRYWLDVARYADSKGYVFTEDRNYPYAYTFRDYVIRSFNEDKPFDKFVTEQLAADKLPPGDDKQPLAAMGFLTVGRRFSNNIHDITDDRIDVVSRGLMGLTVACARCHDHKFDPIPAADYYALYGVFASSNEPKELPLIGRGSADAKVAERFDAEVNRLQALVEDEKERIAAAKRTAVGAAAGGLVRLSKDAKFGLNQGERESLQKKRNAVEVFVGKSPDAPPRAMVMADNVRPTEPVVFLRGNPGTPGPKTTRHLPAVAAAGTATAFKDGSGRLELAKAIASKDNPLTARVFVNRVWTWHFGQGLVRTPSDFGVRSDPPTHPELLDWLASRFVADGWSVKALHRRIITSETYTQGSVTPAAAAQTDVENRWLSHFNRRRHDFEAMRDSLLAVSGKLDPAVYGRSVDLFKPPLSARRSVYAYVDRQNLPGTLRAFDFASPEQHTPQRFQTTVPQQALFLLNSPFVADAARAVAGRAEVKDAPDPAEKVRRLYRAVLGRNPTKEESDLGVQFAAAADAAKPTAGQLSAWEQLAQVLLLSNEFAFAD